MMMMEDGRGLKGESHESRETRDEIPPLDFISFERNTQNSLRQPNYQIIVEKNKKKEPDKKTRRTEEEEVSLSLSVYQM